MSTATKKSAADLQLAFDVGHSSIGWAVLQCGTGFQPVRPAGVPPAGPEKAGRMPASPTGGDACATLLGCGSVIFPADDCLASERRGFRRQRRHIRATRLRIARLKRLLAHLGVLTQEQLDEPGCAWPWLLAARVLRGGRKLTWGELWDVLRWYAHNRGYDGNKGWSRHDAASAEDTEKEQRANERLADFQKRHGRAGTMAEVFCDVLKIDPLGELKSSMERVRNLGAAFPREGVETEVERILRAHLSGVLPELDEQFIHAVMRDHTALAGPEYRLPSRYGQRLADGSLSPGGLLFGQLVPHFDNRIIARCPITFERVYQQGIADGKDEQMAKHEAEKQAKVPGIDCVEFHRFRWAMQLANVTVATGGASKTRGLSVAERAAVNVEMEKEGCLTPGDFKKAVRALTGGAKDNLDQLLSHPDADRALVLDLALKTATGGVLGVLWPHMMTPAEQEEIERKQAGDSEAAKAERKKEPAEAFAHSASCPHKSAPRQIHHRSRAARKGSTGAGGIRSLVGRCGYEEAAQAAQWRNARGAHAPWRARREAFPPPDEWPRPAHARRNERGGEVCFRDRPASDGGGRPALPQRSHPQRPTPARARRADEQPPRAPPAEAARTAARGLDQGMRGRRSRAHPAHHHRGEPGCAGLEWQRPR